MKRHPSRMSADALSQLDRVLSTRDRAILEDLQRFRFLTTKHLEQLHFYDHRTTLAGARICRRVLLRMRELRLIEPLERRIGGIRAGSASFVWRVGPVGDRLIRLGNQAVARDRRKEPSIRHLDHCLTIADCYVALTAASRSGAFELLITATEPQSWRRYLGPFGGSDVLKPDLHVVTATADFEDHWFLEIDRATESVPTVLHKCDQYERYRRTGREQLDDGVFPRVVWVVPDYRRREALQEAIARDRAVDEELFRVITPDELLATVQGGPS